MPKRKEQAQAETALIYGLYHPETDELRYIGKARDIDARLRSHLRDASKRKTPLYAWVRKLGRNGQRPVIRTLIECPITDWPAEERAAIAQYRANGARLLNLADGGNQPKCPVEICRQNAATANAKRPPNVMRAYRRFEFYIRMSRGMFPDLTDWLIERKERFAAAVERHRKQGTLWDLDRRIGERYPHETIS